MQENGSVKSRSKPKKNSTSNRRLSEAISEVVPIKDETTSNPQTTFNLLICVGGIYASLCVSYLISTYLLNANRSTSLTWGVLQERITTTNYGTETFPKKFNSPVVINTVQSTFAAALGYLYLTFTRKTSKDMPIFPNSSIVWPMLLVSITTSLASPFGYASLKHVDYITFTLAKSCKLLPVMALHVTLFRRKYPLYKYAVVALVTAGVAIFTLHHPSSSKKKSKVEGSSAWGLLLLSINLLFDGLTNSTQDQIYKSFKPYSGQQMMCALNILSTILTSAYLLASPYVAQTPIGAYVGMDAATGGELGKALNFIAEHPAVGWDIVAFAACGALGQVFICKFTSSVIQRPSTEHFSLHIVYIWISAVGHCDRDKKDADHDPVCGMVWSQT